MSLQKGDHRIKIENLIAFPGSRAAVKLDLTTEH
jgi:hypothetical protein